MNNLTSEQVYFATLAKATQKLFELARANKKAACILHRAAGNDGNLRKFAKSIGFTHTQAGGIMDGYDISTGRKGVFYKYANNPGYQDGYEIGVRAAQEGL